MATGTDKARRWLRERVRRARTLQAAKTPPKQPRAVKDETRSDIALFSSSMTRNQTTPKRAAQPKAAVGGKPPTSPGPARATSARGPSYSMSNNAASIDTTSFTARQSIGARVLSKPRTTGVAKAPPHPPADSQGGRPRNSTLAPSTSAKPLTARSPVPTARASNASTGGPARYQTNAGAAPTKPPKKPSQAVAAATAPKPKPAPQRNSAFENLSSWSSLISSGKDPVQTQQQVRKKKAPFSRTRRRGADI